MERIFVRILVWLLACSSLLANASSPIDLKDWSSGQLLYGHAEILQHADPQLSFYQLQAQTLPWRALTPDNIDAGFSHDALWLRFTVHNSGSTRKAWTLSQDYSFIEQLDLFLLSQQTLTHRQLNRHRPLDTRDWYYPRLNTEYEINPGETQQIWVRVYNSHVEHINGNLRLWHSPDFARFMRQDVALQFPIIGIILGTIMIWGCLGLVTRLTPLIGYIGFLATFLLSYCRYAGYDPAYLLGPGWNWLPEFQSLAMLTLAMMVVIMRSTTALHRDHPRLDLCFQSLQWSLLALFVATASLLPPSITNPLCASMLALVILLLMPTIIWMAFKRRRHHVTLFAIGQLCFLAAPAVIAFGVLSGTVNNPLLIYPAILFGLLLDSLMLSLSLAYWLKARNQAHQRAEKAARTDALTGLDNRLTLELGIRAQLEHPGSYYFALLDIDHFKQINDRWGHDAGDVVLRHLAQILKDTQQHNDIVGRLGGEEFVIFLKRSSQAQAQTQLQRIRQRFASYKTPYNGSLIEHTLSIGMCSNTNAHADFQALYTRADQALYRAKAAGRNRLIISAETAPRDVAMAS